jgi:phosphoribosylformylglycinamidine cyclo-ligase
VDITAGNRAVELIKPKVKTTWRPEVLADIGSFGGLFALDSGRYQEPVLVSGTDGVGTKLRIAHLLDKHDTIGIDCVAMCVNDVLVHGAEPLFFLDYLAVGRLEPEKVAEIVGGVAEGCRQSGCALIGGETAEMPGFYGDGEYDIAGFVVGVVERSKIITGEAIREGDQLIGLASSGLHSNGYSLARKALLEAAGLSLDQPHPALGRTLGEEMLVPTRIYARELKEMTSRFEVHGLVHITGGGLVENIPRMVPAGLKAHLKRGSWEIPPIFPLIQKCGGVDEAEMFRTFNLGVGMVAIMPPKDAEAAMEYLDQSGIKTFRIGLIEPGDGEVEID